MNSNKKSWKKIPKMVIFTSELNGNFRVSN